MCPCRDHRLEDHALCQEQALQVGQEEAPAALDELLLVDGEAARLVQWVDPTDARELIGDLAGCGLGAPAHQDNEKEETRDKR